MDSDDELFNTENVLSDCSNESQHSTSCLMSGDIKGTDRMDLRLVKSRHLPTPEEFLDIFCPSNLLNMKFTQQILKDSPQHGQIFNILDIIISAETIAQKYSDPTNISQSTVEIDGFESSTITKIDFPMKLSEVQLTSVECCKCTFSYNKLPVKRKANLELYCEIIPAKCTKLQMNDLICLHKPRQENMLFLCDEIAEFGKNHMICLLSSLIHLVNNLKRCKISIIICPSYFVIRTNSYCNIYTNTLNRLSFLYNSNLTYNYVIDEPIVQPYDATNDITMNLNTSRRCLDTDLPIWDTKALIRKLKSFYQQISENYFQINCSFDNSFFLSICKLMSFITTLNYPSIENQSLKSVNAFFEQIYLEQPSEFFSVLVKNIGDTILKIIKRNSNMSRLKMIRIISFILFGIRNKLEFPVESINVAVWYPSLRWICKYDSCFMRFYREIELMKSTRKNKFEFYIKLFNQMFYELYLGASVQNERLINCIYECLCGKLFNTYHQWNLHSFQCTRNVNLNQFHFNSHLIMDYRITSKSHKINKTHMKVFKTNMSYAYKYQILSNSKTCPIFWD